MEIERALQQLELLQKKLYAYHCADSSLYLDAVTTAPSDTSEGRGVAMSILNASLRLMRITHIDIQRVLYSLTREFDAMCRTAMRTSLDQMSNYAPMTDILAANHVKAHVRLFMS